MEQAIKKAIEGGYDNLTVSQFQAAKDSTLKWQLYCLDPLFWQALGKSLGYKSSYQKSDPEWHTMTIGDMQSRTPHALFLRFMEHVWQGKSADEFFTNLLN